MPRARWAKIGVALAAVLLVLFGPHVAWRLTTSRTLDVVIVDKTVPFRNYREHAAIPWILHALSIRTPRGDFLDPARDYVGFDPETKKGLDLTAARLARADVLFVTDTYGVYVGDYERRGDIAALERSPKIYGGMSVDEAAAIEGFVARGGLVFAEFNTFASPTGDDARARLQKLFGVRWTKWVARYWPSLEDPDEVPRWVGRVFERVTGAPFAFTGPGLVFVRDDVDMVVLRPEDLTAEVVAQVRTPAGAALGLPERGAFWFWMDIVEVQGGEVLVDHVLGVTERGAAKLAAHGIPRRFPALVKNAGTYYFAGDFVDNAIDLGSPERAGVIATKQRTTGCGGGSTGDEGFFWGFYAPTLARLLEPR